MYLHRMTIQALGPFVGQHTIEFADLAASGLFLLEGPTGSGKSTLIDAIVFAIYGKVASRDASEDRLRSAHAAPEVETFVDLVLETGSGIYRVRRSPAYQRPKQRGAGTTLQQAQVRLWRLTSPDARDGDVLSIRADEVGAELRRAVGLDREQFVQTIVLPQGEFAGFLRADPESRRGLLQQVFGTEVYERVQQRLERMRAEVGRAVEESRQSVDRAVARFVGAAGPAQDDPVRVAGPGSAVDAARTVCADLLTAADQAAAAAALARKEADQARAEHDRRQRLAEVVLRRDRARVELLALDDGAAQHAEDRERVAAARRVLPVLPLVGAVDRAAQVLTDAQLAVDLARRAASEPLRAVADAAGASCADGDVAESGGADGAAGSDRSEQALVAERDRSTGKRAALARSLDLEAALEERAATLTAAAASAAQAEAALVRARAEVEARPAARTELDTARSAAATSAADLGAATARLAAVEERWVAAVDAARLAKEISVAQAARGAAATAALAAVDTVARLQRARIAGMAGELAEQLVDDAPCPVCGGLDHPSPATRLDPVDDADLAAAEEHRALTSAAVESAAANLERLRERHEQRSHAAGAAAEELEVTVAGARTAVTGAQEAAVELAGLEAALGDFDEGTRVAVAAVTGQERAIAVEAERRAAAAGELERDRAEVLAARAGAPSVAARVAELERIGGEAATWIRALDLRRRAQDDAALAAQALADGLVQHQMADVDEVDAARLAPAELTRLEAAIRDREVALARARGVLEEPEVHAIGDLTDVDVPGALAFLTASSARADSSTAEAVRHQHRLAEADAALTGLIDAVDRHERDAADAEPVVRMANVAAASSADNTRQLTLATYVLGRRFDDLVLAANARLVTMSDGRYELLHSDRREDVRTRRTGLALAVLDHRTESSRDPRTLSGGETFYVSLCLALGLADVVTAEAGGIDLGTLFVDEGFGSLDPETLDAVLAELSRLRDGGRVVGVVSHVEAMKSMIPERIEVRRAPGGGSTLTVRA